MGADGSSGSSQQCPRDEAELRYTAQRGKVPGTLQKNGPENMTAWKQGMKGKAGTSMTNFKERTVKCQVNCCLPGWQGSCQTIWWCHFYGRDPVQVLQELSRNNDGLCCVHHTYLCSRMRALSAFPSSWSLGCQALTDISPWMDCPTDKEDTRILCSDFVLPFLSQEGLQTHHSSI